MPIKKGIWNSLKKIIQEDLLADSENETIGSNRFYKLVIFVTIYSCFMFANGIGQQPWSEDMNGFPSFVEQAEVWKAATSLKLQSTFGTVFIWTKSYPYFL